MTVLCGGGTSTTKSGVLASVAYSSALIADLLVLIESPWLIPVIPLLTIPPITTSTFCATDPPAMPTFTSAEATALLNLAIGTSDWNSGVSKMSDLLGNAVWNQLCECSNATGVPTPTGPTPPTGVTVIQLPGSPGTQPCNQGNYNTSSATFTNGSTTNIGGNPFPINYITNGTFVLVNEIAAGTGCDLHVNIVWQNNGTLRTDTFTVLSGQTVTASITAPATSRAFIISATGIAGTGAADLRQTTWELFCTGGSLPNQTNPCEPDPVTNALLNTILQMVTLIQRQIVPFSYIASTTHSGLTGSGELDVQGLLGVKITPTVTPPNEGIVTGDPDTIWLNSWVNWGNADGWIPREFLRSAPHISMPQLASQWTKLGYTLAPGLTVDIQELKREA